MTTIITISNSYFSALASSQNTRGLKFSTAEERTSHIVRSIDESKQRLTGTANRPAASPHGQRQLCLINPGINNGIQSAVSHLSTRLVQQLRKFLATSSSSWSPVCEAVNLFALQKKLIGKVQSAAWAGAWFIWWLHDGSWATKKMIASQPKISWLYVWLCVAI